MRDDARAQDSAELLGVDCGDWRLAGGLSEVGQIIVIVVVDANNTWTAGNSIIVLALMTLGLLEERYQTSPEGWIASESLRVLSSGWSSV
jgi:hypothetical protein